MSRLDRYLKALILVVWGAAIALRELDIKGTSGAPALSALAPDLSAARADTIDILMSLVIIAAAVLLIGRVRKAWLVLTIAIVASKVIAMAADARVGDLPPADLAATGLITFALPALVLALLIRSRSTLEAEATPR